MISRLSICAALFSVLATASIGYAATVQHEKRLAAPPVIELPTIVVTGKRAAA